MRNRGMRARAAVVVGVGLAAMGASAWPAAAASPHGQTVSVTQNVHGVFDEPQAGTNPCNGDTLNSPDGKQGIQFTGNLVDHVTLFTNSDEGWGTFTETGAVAATDAVTGVVYSGHSTVWGNFNMNERNQTSAFTFNMRVIGSDGSSITAHETTVFAQNANGDVTVNFDDMSLTCG